LRIINPIVLRFNNLETTRLNFDTDADVFKKKITYLIFYIENRWFLFEKKEVFIAMVNSLNVIKSKVSNTFVYLRVPKIRILINTSLKDKRGMTDEHACQSLCRYIYYMYFF